MFLHVFKNLSLEILDNSENLAKNAQKLATPIFFVFSFQAGVVLREQKKIIQFGQSYILVYTLKLIKANFGVC